MSRRRLPVLFFLFLLMFVQVWLFQNCGGKFQTLNTNEVGQGDLGSDSNNPPPPGNLPWPTPTPTPPPPTQTFDFVSGVDVDDTTPDVTGTSCPASQINLSNMTELSQINNLKPPVSNSSSRTALEQYLAYPGWLHRAFAQSKSGAYAWMYTKVTEDTAESLARRVVERCEYFAAGQACYVFAVNNGAKTSTGQWSSAGQPILKLENNANFDACKVPFISDAYRTRMKAYAAKTGNKVAVISLNGGFAYRSSATASVQDLLGRSVEACEVLNAGVAPCFIYAMGNKVLMAPLGTNFAFSVEFGTYSFDANRIPAMSNEARQKLSLYTAFAEDHDENTALAIAFGNGAWAYASGETAEEAKGNAVQKCAELAGGRGCSIYATGLTVPSRKK